MTRQVRLLARHFFWRFLDNDLISPDSDVHETGALFMAFLAVPGLLGTGLLLLKYASPWITPYERLVLALPDKSLYIAWSMLVMALVTLVDWDALALDARDYAILGPLPLASSTLLAGKLVALVLFVSVVVIAVNVIPTVFFPLVYMSSTAAKVSLPVGIRMASWMALGHAVSCVAASVFAFLAVVALRSVLVFALGPRSFRRVSLWIQFVAVLALVIGFFNSHSPQGAGGSALYVSPPMWFLGLYEVIAGRMIPGMPPDTALPKWQVPQEHEAREAYAALQPLFPGLAAIALLAVAAVALIALAFYFAAHFRHASRLRQPATLEPAARLLVRRRLESAARRFVVRDPLAQASFFFTWHTLARSLRHKLFAGGYVAAGLLLIYTTIAPLVVRPPDWIFLGPSAPLLSLQFVLSFFVLVGLRVVFTVPAELRANWVFRLTTGSGVGRYLSGVRRLLAVIIGPFFIALIPVHALLWGWRAALLHCGFGVLWALVLVEVLLLGLEKLPFTCSHVSGKGNLKVFWPVYLFAFALYVYAFAGIEAAALRTSGGSARLGAFLLALLGGLAVYRSRRLSHQTAFVFDELSDATPVTLGL